MKKLRFIQDPVVFQRKRYVQVMDGKSAIEVMKLRLNMVELYGNYKNNLALERLCPLCCNEEDTTEHLFTCNEISQKKINATQLSNEDNPELWRQINELVSFNMLKREALEPGKTRMRHRQKRQNSIKKKENLKNDQKKENNCR